MDNKEARILLEKYRTGACTPEEKQLVEQWFAELVDTGEWQWEATQKGEVSQRMENRLLQQINNHAATPPHRVHYLKRTMWWAAAVLLLLIGAGSYYVFINKKAPPTVANLSAKQRFRNDITPAKQQVVLTLPDGSTQVLDSLTNGAITLQGMQAIKKDGSITYSNNKEIVFHTISTEKGRTFHLQLSDSTKVWLDALSSIRFPTAFAAGPRVVETTGQVYFEVAGSRNGSGKKIPFLVKSGNQVVEVLGTHFNVNSHDQQSIQTTLLEGSVRVVSRQSVPPQSGSNRQKNTELAAVLQPGEQAVVASHSQPAPTSRGFTIDDSRLTIDHSPDLDQVMAWKNGRFQFNGNNVQEIMEQLKRWYNIEVVYKDNITETFVADIDRDLPVSRLLELLEMTKQVRFEISGNKVIVMK